MLKYYLVCYSTLYNGQVINNYIGHVILDETAATETQHIPITWENLNEINNEYGLSCAFNIWNCRKGRKIEFSRGVLQSKNGKLLTSILNSVSHTRPIMLLLKIL